MNKKKMLAGAIGMIAVTGLAVVAGIGAAAAQVFPTAGFQEASSAAVMSDKGLPGLIEQGAQMARSTEVRAILGQAAKAGHIDRKQYDLAHKRYVSCMADHGYSATFRVTKFGTYVELPYREVADGDALDSAVTACTDDMSLITALYRVQQANPKLLKDGRSVALQCLQGDGIVSSDYTVQDLNADLQREQFPFDPTAAGPNDCLYAGGISYLSAE